MKNVTLSQPRLAYALAHPHCVFTIVVGDFFFAETLLYETLMPV